jgi:tetratricopeptide (TPR) repeat protein
VQGYAYRKLGEYKKAVEDVSRSILIDPEPVRFANRGYAYLAIRDYSAALADAKAGILMNASYPVNYGVEALALHGLGQTTGAISSIQTAIDLSPGNVHFWHVKGKLLADSGDCIGAAAAFRKSLKIDPDYDLPYPGFSGARDSLESLNTTCGPIFLALPSLPPNSFAEYLVAIVQ